MGRHTSKITSDSRTFDWRRSVMLLATLIGSLSCGDGPESQTSTYLLDTNQVTSLLQLVAQTSALAARHAELPSGLDFAADGASCPGGQTDGTISIGLGNCSNEDGLVCQLQESYDCDLVRGTIVGAVVQTTDTVSVSLAPDAYAEGSTSALGVELRYGGSLTVYTTAEKTAVVYALTVTLASLDTKDPNAEVAFTELALSGTLRPTITEEQILFNGAITLGTPLGDIIVFPKDWGFDRPKAGETLACPGPESGRVTLEFVGAEIAHLDSASCSRHEIRYASLYDDTFVLDTVVVTPSVMDSTFLTSGPEFQTFIKSDQNVQPAVDLFFDTGNRYWCNLIPEPEANLLSQGAGVSLTETVALYAECAVFVDGTPFSSADMFLKGIVAFTKPLAETSGDELESVKVVTATVGTPAFADDGTVTMTDTKSVDVQTISNLSLLSPAIACYYYGSSVCSALGGSPYTPIEEVSRTYSTELNHFGAWLQDEAGKGAQFFAIFGLD